MASNPPFSESRSLRDCPTEEPLLQNRERCFETDSKYSLSSFASTRLPTLSNFSGPTSSNYLAANRSTATGPNPALPSLPESSTVVKGSSTGVLSSATVNSSSYPPRARSNFVLGPTKSVIFAANNNGDMQGVDENIYHWKVLNLSRAKLKASSRTSALLSGFAMVAMVEIQIDEKVPTPLLITFSACTVLLIAVHMLALMISTCILPNVEAVANLHFQTSKTVFESPHMKMNAIVELAWGFSTVLGILLFLVEIAILCWVKFYNFSHSAAWTATGLLIPIMIVFIAFAAHFYLKLVSHKSEVYEDGIKELELLKGQLSTAEEGQTNSEEDQSVTPTAASGAVQVV